MTVILRVATPFVVTILVAIFAISVTSDPSGRVLIMLIAFPFLARLAWRLIVSLP